MSRPSRQLPARARRRALAVDLLAAAAIAAVAIALAAGVGVLGFVALPVLLVLLAWIGVEALTRRLRARRQLS